MAMTRSISDWPAKRRVLRHLIFSLDVIDHRRDERGNGWTHEAVIEVDDKGRLSPLSLAPGHKVSGAGGPRLLPASLLSAKVSQRHWRNNGKRRPCRRKEKGTWTPNRQAT